MIKNPYAKAQQIDLQQADGSKTEGYALVEIARRMEEARANSDDKQKIVEIVRLNWRIWTIFQTELMRDDNTVPEAIRNNLLSLSRFVDKRSVDIIARPTPEKLAILININRQIGAGLLESSRKGENDADTVDTSNANNEHNPLDEQVAESDKIADTEELL